MRSQKEPIAKGCGRQGISGLTTTSFVVASRGRACSWSKGPRHGQDHDSPAVSAGRGGGGERGLYVTLSETEKELRAGRGIARLGARRADRHIRAGAAGEPARSRPAAEPALFVGPRAGRDDAADLRGRRTLWPERVVLDSLSEIRLLAQSSLRYRRQILALKHYFARRGTTVMLLDDLTAETHDKTVHSVAHGVIRLERAGAELWGGATAAAGREISGRAFRGGYHDFVISQGGVQYFPGWWRPSIEADFAGLPNPAASRPWIRSWAAGWSVDRVPSFSVRRAPANRCWRCSSSPRRCDAASGRRCSSSTRNWVCCSTGPSNMGIDIEAMRDAGEPVHRADRRRGAVAGRIRASVSAPASTSMAPDGRDRQPQRLSGRDARGAGR